jgi:hypothetical protein
VAAKLLVRQRIGVQTCSLRKRHIKIATASHTASAVTRIAAALWNGSSFQTSRPKVARARAPIAAPRASSAAASRPRIVRGIPAQRFRSRSCFSIRVALEEKMAGKARNNPPTTGPKCVAISPVATVMRPPSRKRVKYSCHWVCLSEARSIRILMVYFRNAHQSPKAQTPHTRSIEKVAGAARTRLFVRR